MGSIATRFRLKTSYSTAPRMPSIPSINSIWVAVIPVVLQGGRQVGVGGEITLLSIEIYEKSETTVCDYSAEALFKL